MQRAEKERLYLIFKTIKGRSILLARGTTEELAKTLQILQIEDVNLIEEIDNEQRKYEISSTNEEVIRKIMDEFEEGQIENRPFKIKENNRLFIQTKSETERKIMKEIIQKNNLEQGLKEI